MASGFDAWSADGSSLPGRLPRNRRDRPTRRGRRAAPIARRSIGGASVFAARADQMSGPGDFFEISGNSSPDLPDEDDEVHEPQDYAGDYPLEGEDGGDGEDE
jgi:hypothetical protein